MFYNYGNDYIFITLYFYLYISNLSLLISSHVIIKNDPCHIFS